MKVLILHRRLSGYFAACLEALKASAGAELLIYAWPLDSNVPFDGAIFSSLGTIHDRSQRTVRQILKESEQFAPDCVLVSGWADKGYLQVCEKFKKKGISVISGCDTQWRGSLRQHLAALTARFHVRKCIDVLWVSGERQRWLAQALGYSGTRCWDGYYSCDWNRFAVSNPCPAARSFLFVGRYVPEKGVDILAEAYRRYREMVGEPWDLVCSGSGALRDTLLNAGAKDLGFVQPRDLPAVMQKASAFVLPSRFEPWGVVAHEAAAAGLPLILSDACGSSVHLLRHLYNGYCFPSGSVGALLQALIKMHNLSPECRAACAKASFDLSKQYTPARWADTLVSGMEHLSC